MGAREPRLAECLMRSFLLLGLLRLYRFGFAVGTAQVSIQGCCLQILHKAATQPMLQHKQAVQAGHSLFSRCLLCQVRMYIIDACFELQCAGA